jgi:hypothetical protein
MSDMVPGKRRYGVPEYRDKISACLETAYAENNLELAEYEKRLDLANSAESIEELDALVHDFPENRRPGALAPAEISDEESSDAKIVILGDQHLTAEDFCGKEIKTISIIGDVNIDIRRFRNSPEPVRIKIYSLIGDTRVIIPRGMKVKNRVKNLLGDYELVRNRPGDQPPEQQEDQGFCILEGFNLLGDISIQEEGSRKKGFLRNFFKGWND